MYIETAKKEFGTWLKNQREEKKIKRSKLATAMGYQNLNKGCRRVVAFENGDTEPNPTQVSQLQEALQISPEQWSIERAKVSRARHLGQIYSKSQSKIIFQTEQALARHAETLLQRLEQIEQARHWRHIHLHGQQLFMAYLGGGTGVHLGPLLKIWNSGGLRTDLPNGEFLLTSGQCSPLSGAHTVDGFFLATGELKRTRSLARGVATSLIGNAIRPMREGSLGNSSWSLPQLLSQLDISIEPAEIFWQREYIGHYDFHTAKLYCNDSVIEFPLLQHHVHGLNYADYSTEESWGAPTTGGRIIIGNILTGQAGAYLGERHSVHTPQGNWTLLPGCASNPAGFPTLHWTADIPPLVQVWLIQNLNILS